MKRNNKERASYILDHYSRSLKDKLCLAKQLDRDDETRLDSERARAAKAETERDEAKERARKAEVERDQQKVAIRAFVVGSEATIKQLRKERDTARRIADKYMSKVEERRG